MFLGWLRMWNFTERGLSKSSGWETSVIGNVEIVSLAVRACLSSHICGVVDSCMPLLPRHRCPLPLHCVSSVCLCLDKDRGSYLTYLANCSSVWTLPITVFLDCVVSSLLNSEHNKVRRYSFQINPTLSWLNLPFSISQSLLILFLNSSCGTQSFTKEICGWESWRSMK